MRVLVNQLVTLGHKTGVGHYTGQLLRGLRLLAPDEQIDAFPDGWLRRAARAVLRARPYLGGAGMPVVSHAERVAPLGRLRGHTLAYLRRANHAVIGSYFRSVCDGGAYDLYHEPNGIAFPSDCPTAITLHDLSVLLHPQWHPADRVAYHEKHFRTGLKNCAHVFAVSEFSRQEVIRHLGLAPHQVTKTYNGIRAHLGVLPQAEVHRVLDRLGLPSRYLLYLGTLEPRKNVAMLLRAYCSLPEALRADWPLLLVGSWGWNAGEVADYLHSEARRRGVLHLGYVRDRHLAAIYNGARALVYPSWYEGFGLPPVEMLACGGAVLASTAGAVAETVGDQAHLIDPGDFDGWRGAIIRVLTDDDWWHALRHGAQEAVKPFTWSACAATTLSVYRRLTNTSPPIPLQPHSAPALRRAAG